MTDTAPDTDDTPFALAEPPMNEPKPKRTRKSKAQPTTTAGRRSIDGVWVVYNGMSEAGIIHADELDARREAMNKGHQVVFVKLGESIAEAITANAG